MGGYVVCRIIGGLPHTKHTVIAMADSAVTGVPQRVTSREIRVCIA